MPRDMSVDVCAIVRHCPSLASQNRFYPSKGKDRYQEKIPINHRPYCTRCTAFCKPRRSRCPAHQLSIVLAYLRYRSQRGAKFGLASSTLFHTLILHFSFLPVFISTFQALNWEEHCVLNGELSEQRSPRLLHCFLASFPSYSATCLNGVNSTSLQNMPQAATFQ